MKKGVLITLIVLVLATIGVFLYFELSVKEIFYVSDYEAEIIDNRYSVKRLYSSDVNIEEFNEQIEKLISLEFTEEDIMQAALEAGTPEFYPAFHIYSYSREEDDCLVLDIAAVQELAENQQNMNFCMDNIRLEVVTNGVTIKEFNSHSGNWHGSTSDSQHIINDEKNGLAVGLGSFGDAELVLDGNTGIVVLQFSYDVRSQSMFPKEVLTDCFLRMDINLSVDDKGNVIMNCSKNEATTVDEYIEQE